MSIIIVNYFSEHYIEPLVEKLVVGFTSRNFEVIIVSNSPSAFKWSDEYMKAYQISIIETYSNEGFGRGVNRGVSKASYDFICLVNPDMNFEANVIEQLYAKFYNADKEIGAISCTVKNLDGSKQTNFFMNKSLKLFDFTMTQIKNTMPSTLRSMIFSSQDLYNHKINNVKYKKFEVGGFYCSFVLIRKSVFEEMKGFDPDFFMYSEDIDFFRTRFPKTYKCMIYPQYEVTHFSGKTDKYGLMSRQSKVSYLLYLRKVGNTFLIIYILFGSFKYLLLLLQNIFKKRDDAKEAIEFFESLKYLATICKYPRGYGTLSKCLKISEISD